LFLNRPDGTDDEMTVAVVVVVVSSSSSFVSGVAGYR
jgi:hypothetical protein